MTEITDIEFTQILEENGFSESQVKFVLDEFFLFKIGWFDKDTLAEENIFNAWQIRFLIKLFDVK